MDAKTPMPLPVRPLPFRPVPLGDAQREKTADRSLPALTLINVVLDGDYQFEQEVPLGLGHLAAYLRRHGFPVTLHQCFASRGEEALDAAMAVEGDLYGFQLNMVNYVGVRTVAAGLKARRPEARILLGGPFLSSLAETIIEHEPLFDAMVYGEGELTLLEIMEQLTDDTLDYATIAGVVWRNAAGRAVRNPPRPLIPDLDSLPFPARDNLEEATRDERDGNLLGSVRVVTSRGCVANCTFCSVNFYTRLQKGKIWRGRSPTHVVDELEELTTRYRARLFNFADSSFEDPGPKGKRRTREICNQIIQRRLPLSIKVYMRGDSMLEPGDEDLLRLWKQAGVDVIIVGVEAGSGQELQYYGKKATIAQNMATLERLKKLDLFYVIIGFIMFGPNSTMESIRANMAFLARLGWLDNPEQIFSVLMLIRDSALYRDLAAEGRIIQPQNPWELPKYTFLDPRAERAARHWDALFGRYPNALQLNHNQINFENLMTRIDNPMNAAIKAAVGDDFGALRDLYLDLKKEFGQVQHDYVIRVLDLIDTDAPDNVLKKTSQDFFVGTYGRYLPRYRHLFDSAVARMAATGLGLSGILFKNFYSHSINEGLERV
ncbi:MAG: B12-binding domain-containing radical SAM protein [Magnetococcales bacterium]|nr:B12-binding domain-containing radical SAM protein [Magnetococcales bacterium]